MVQQLMLQLGLKYPLLAVYVGLSVCVALSMMIKDITEIRFSISQSIKETPPLVHPHHFDCLLEEDQEVVSLDSPLTLIALVGETVLQAAHSPLAEYLEAQLALVE